MAVSTTAILILGSTGLIGEHITNAIVTQKDKFRRIAIFTSRDTASSKKERITELEKNGVEIIVGDITSETDVSHAYSGIDTVISCVGRQILHQQLQLIEWAEKHPDVKRFFPSEYGTDIEHGPESANEKPHQQKLRVRALLKDVKNLEYTYVVTGPYADANHLLYLDAKPPATEAEGSFDAINKRAVLLGDGNGKVGMTTMEDVGKLVTAAILHPEHVRNKAIHVNSFTATPHEVLAEFERQTGDSKWTVSYTSLDELKRIEAELWAKGEPRAAATTLRRIWTSGGTLYEKRDNDLVGMEDGVESLQDAVRRAISKQRLAASSPRG